jgi:hypothetical protein
MPCSHSNVSNGIPSQSTRLGHNTKGDPRTFHSKRVVAASHPTSRVWTNSIRKSSVYSAHARRNAGMFLRSLTPMQLANLRAAIIHRLKERRTNLKEQHQLKVCNASSNSSELTLPRCQSNHDVCKDHTTRPIFATHFHARSALKLPNDNSSDSINQSVENRRSSMQVQSDQRLSWNI